MSESNEEQFNPMASAFKELVHKEKQKHNPEYDGANPSNEDELKRDLEKLGIVKKPENQIREELLKIAAEKKYPIDEVKDLPLAHLRALVQSDEVLTPEQISEIGGYPELVKKVAAGKREFKDTVTEELREKLGNTLDQEFKRKISADAQETSRVQKINTKDLPPTITDMVMRQGQELGLSEAQIQEILDADDIFIKAKEIRATQKPQLATTRVEQKNEDEAWQSFEKILEESLQHAETNSRLVKKSQTTPTAPETKQAFGAKNERPEFDLAEADRIRAHAYSLGIKIPVRADQTDMRKILNAELDKLLEQVKSKNPNDEVLKSSQPDLVALKIYTMLAKPGQSYSEVASSEEFELAVRQAKATERKYLEKWKPKTEKLEEVSKPKPEITKDADGTEWYVVGGARFKKVGPGKIDKEAEKKTDFQIVEGAPQKFETGAESDLDLIEIDKRVAEKSLQDPRLIKLREEGLQDTQEYKTIRMAVYDKEFIEEYDRLVKTNPDAAKLMEPQLKAIRLSAEGPEDISPFKKESAAENADTKPEDSKQKFKIKRPKYNSTEQEDAAMSGLDPYEVRQRILRDGPPISKREKARLDAQAKTKSDHQKTNEKEPESKSQAKTDEYRWRDVYGDREGMKKVVAAYMEFDNQQDHPASLENIDDEDLKRLYLEYTRTPLPKEAYEKLANDELVETVIRTVKHYKIDWAEDDIRKTDPENLKAFLLKYHPTDEDEANARGVESKETSAEQVPEKKKLFAAEISDYIDAYARQEACRQWQEVYSKSNFFRRVQLHMGENYYVDVDLYNKIKSSIENNRTLVTLLRTRVAGREVQVERGEEAYRLTDAIIEAYEKELHLKENEKAEKVEVENLDQKLGELTIRHYKEKWDRTRCEQEIAQMVGDIYKSNRTLSSESEGKVFASNIYQYIESWRDQIESKIAEAGPENEEGLRLYINGLMNVDLYLAKADSDIRKEPKKLGIINSYIPAALQRNKYFGVIANPAVYGSVVSLAARAFAKKSTTGVLATGTAVFMAPTAASFVAPLIAAAVVGGAYTALRRNKEVTEDWTQERMQQAMGRDAGERGSKMRSFMLNMVDASARAAEINAIADPTDANKQLVAETLARVEVEDAGGQELFRASAENANLASRKVDMNKLYEALKQLEAKPGFNREELSSLVDAEKTRLREEFKAKEDALFVFRRNQNTRAAVSGAITSMAGGLVTQEAIHWTKEGLNIVGANLNVDDTAIGRVGHRIISGEWGKTYVGELTHSADFSSIDSVQATVHTPQGFGFAGHTDGTVDLLYNGEHVADSLHLDAKGFTDESIKTLQDQGFEVQVVSGHTTITVEDVKNIVSTPEFSAQNLKEQFPEGNWGQHHRVDWHHQGPQESTFFNRVIEHPGKEQMLYLSKDQAGNVVVDAHKIVENLAQNLQDGKTEFVNPDGSVDSKMSELIGKLTGWKNSGELGRHIQAVIIPDRGSPISATFDADSNGRITLPESLSKLVTEPTDGKLPFMIELRLDDGHVLATASGGGMLEKITEPITERIPKEIDTYSTYLRPTVFNDAGPMLSTPAAKRYNLETTEIQPIISSSGDRATKTVLGDTFRGPQQTDSRFSNADFDQYRGKSEPTVAMPTNRAPEENVRIVDGEIVDDQKQSQLQEGPYSRSPQLESGPDTKRKELAASEQAPERLKLDDKVSPEYPYGQPIPELGRAAWRLIKEISTVEQLEGQNKLRLEDYFSKMYETMKAIAVNKKLAPRLFKQMMLAFGFSEKDWSIGPKNQIRIKNIDNVKELSEWYKQDANLKILFEWMQSIQKAVRGEKVAAINKQTGSLLHSRNSVLVRKRAHIVGPSIEEIEKDISSQFETDSDPGDESD